MNVKWTIRTSTAIHFIEQDYADKGKDFIEGVCKAQVELWKKEGVIRMRGNNKFVPWNAVDELFYIEEK